MSALKVLNKIIPLIPDSDPMRKELEEFKNDIFLELPEDRSRLLRRIGLILNKGFPAGNVDDLNPWQIECAVIYKDEVLENNNNA